MSRHIGAIKLYIICIKKGRGYIPKKWNNIKKILRKTLPWKINTILSLRRVWCFKGFYKTTVWTLTNFLTMRTESYLDISESYLPIVMGWSIVWHSNQSVLPSKWSDKACSDLSRQSLTQGCQAQPNWGLVDMRMVMNSELWNIVNSWV